MCVLMNIFMISSNADEEGEPATDFVTQDSVEETQEVTEGNEEKQEENNVEETKI